MPAPFPWRRRLHCAASLAFGLSLAASALKLTACFVNAGPPNPHEEPDGGDPPDPPDADPPDPHDAGEEAG
jgi:hypothetical protein